MIGTMKENLMDRRRKMGKLNLASPHPVNMTNLKKKTSNTDGTLKTMRLSRMELAIHCTRGFIMRMFKFVPLSVSIPHTVKDLEK